MTIRRASAPRSGPDSWRRPSLSTITADVTAAPEGIALASAEPERHEQAERLLGLTLDGTLGGPLDGLKATS
ncbi:hypothetical protein [Streptomyces sp. NBC_01089]|uniref:hypothetical protein n=1 Tax=Streptomyces sp. NBC_01089 TaxID=2903747 RepID=UPI003868FAC4|nr:hypothetical protein OG510_35015 [Streptomyces sp. NBC_01089]